VLRGEVFVEGLCTNLSIKKGRTTEPGHLMVDNRDLESLRVLEKSALEFGD
jgi:hypothetical protein